MSNEHYTPGQIKFTRRQVLWLIENLRLLREGYWPTESSSYIEIPQGRRIRRRRAIFTTPIEYAAEIMIRLEKCGIDGLILEARVGWDKSYESLAAYFHKPIWSIKKREKQALRYVASGPAMRWVDTSKRKGQNYKSFFKKT